MKTPKLFTLALSLALFLFAADSAFAKSKSKSKSKSGGNNRPPPVKITTKESTIIKVGTLSITVKSGNETRNYGIDDNTMVTVASVRSSAGKLQKGMRVSVRPSTLDPTMAQSITVDDLTIRTAAAPKQAAPKQAAVKKPSQPTSSKKK